MFIINIAFARTFYSDNLLYSLAFYLHLVFFFVGVLVGTSLFYRNYLYTNKK